MVGRAFGAAWHLTLFFAVVGLLGGGALVIAAAQTAGPALGTGLFGTKVFVTGIGPAYSDAADLQAKMDEAEANQAAKEQAAKDKRAAAKRKAAGN